MNNRDEIVTVELINKAYQIKCDPKKAKELAKSAKHLNKKLTQARDHNQINNITDLALIVALNLSHELLYRDNAVPKELAKIEKQATQLQQKIKKQLASTPQQPTLPEIRESM